MNETIAASRAEVQRLNAEREKYEETMKKAFMRGVCALNLEAMSMFQNEEGAGLVYVFTIMQTAIIWTEYFIIIIIIIFITKLS